MNDTGGIDPMKTEKCLSVSGPRMKLSVPSSRLFFQPRAVSKDINVLSVYCVMSDQDESET